jgi:hypothetical protein
MRSKSQLIYFCKRSWPALVAGAYTLAAVTWSMPSGSVPGKRTVDFAVAPFMIGLNLWQSWDMFAPNPRSEDIWVSVSYETLEGPRGEVRVTKMLEMSYFERWQRERWRKYFNDHLRTDVESLLWRPYAEYLKKEIQAEGYKPSKIELTRWWRATEKPVSPDLRADVRKSPWNSYTFYRWHMESSQGGNRR